jgi:transcriptional repressor NF-X1
MSNLPPDPPDPPISTDASALLSSDSLTNRNNSHRARHRGRGRGRGQSQHAHVVVNEPGTSVPRGRRGHRASASKERSPASSERAGMNSVYPRSLSGSGPSGGPADASRGPTNRHTGRNPVEKHSDNPRSVSLSIVDSRNQGRSRRGQFGSQLTEQRSARVTPYSRRAPSPPPNSDLTTRLTYALRTPPYPDCPICFNPLHPAQPTWSCSLSDEVTTTCCWASFHLKCVREWAKKSTKEIRDAFVAREVSEEEYWRCPGCQTKRKQVPRNYS